MAQRQRRPEAQDPRGELIEAEVVLGSSENIPLLFANQILVNYLGGTEVLVTVVAAVPEPFQKGVGPEALKKVPGRILGRYSIPLNAWRPIIQSINDQLAAIPTQ